MAFVVDSIKKALPSRPRTRRCPACPALKLPLVLLRQKTAQGPGDLVGEGDAMDAGEEADKEAAKAKVSGPIPGILQMEIQEATRLERKEMRNTILHILHSKEETCHQALYW